MFGLGRVLATVAVASMVMLTVVDLAEARRAGSGFGSRGTRTFSPRRSPARRRRCNADQPDDDAAEPGDAAAPRPAEHGPGGASRRAASGRLFGGFAGSMLGGLALGGLIGMMMGNGLGGAAGFLGLILQMALIGGAVMLAMRFFRGRQTASPAGYSPRQRAAGSPIQVRRIGNAFLQDSADRRRSPRAAEPNRAAHQPSRRNRCRRRDLGQFETMLKQVQAAYAAEDYGTLRKLTTPEAMSWLAEELSENATKGLKNEVCDVHLVQGDVAEAWNEDGADYATVAMRYESIDVTRDRATGRVVEGDPDNLTEAVELWTFLRKRGGDWQVSAIQGMAA